MLNGRYSGIAFWPQHSPIGVTPVGSGRLKYSLLFESQETSTNDSNGLRPLPLGPKLMKLRSPVLCKITFNWFLCLRLPFTAKLQFRCSSALGRGFYLPCRKYLCPPRTFLSILVVLHFTFTHHWVTGITNHWDCCFSEFYVIPRPPYLMGHHSRAGSEYSPSTIAGIQYCEELLGRRASWPSALWCMVVHQL